MRQNSTSVHRIYNDSKQMLYKNLYRQIATDIKDKLAYQDYLNFAICGGRSVSDLFLLFADNMHDIDWQRVNIYMVDERLVPIDSGESNYKLAYDSFISKLLNVGLTSNDNIFPFIYKPDDQDLGISKYRNSLSENGGKFDIVLLSAGEDGHIGALYPNHNSIKNNSDYFFTMDDSPKPPRARMTSSRKLLLHSDIAYLFVMGEGKRNVLKSLFNDIEKDDYIECPARIIYNIPKSYLITNLKGD